MLTWKKIKVIDPWKNGKSFCQSRWVSDPFIIEKYETHFCVYIKIDEFNSVEVFDKLYSLGQAKGYTENIANKILNQLDKRIIDLEKTLKFYIEETGIGTTVLPEVDPPLTGTMSDEIDTLKRELAYVKGKAEEYKNKLESIKDITTT
jgi:hypothetical protein